MLLPRLSRPLSFALLLSAALVPPGAAQCELQDLRPLATPLGPVTALDGPSFAIGGYPAIQVFRQEGRTAYLQQEILLDDIAPGRGSVVRLALEGDVLAATLLTQGLPDHVRVYERAGRTWREVARIEDPVIGGLLFGFGLALGGGRLYVGAPNHPRAGINRAGVVYAYERRAGSWTLVEELGAEPPRSIEHFGRALDIDGSRLAVSAPLGFSNSQSVYVLERTDTGWEQTRLTPAEPITAAFGEFLDLRGDVLLVGDSSSDRGNGRAWVFEHDGTGWTETGVLTQPGAPVFGFGDSVALSDDGRRAYLGSPNEDQPARDSGAIHVFEKLDGVWQRGDVLLPARPGFLHGFGTQLGCAGDLLVATCADGTATTLSESGTLCRTLFAQPEQVSLSRGGRQTLRLNPGSEHAGREFLLMGSATGFQPGFRIGGQRVPLVPDAYLLSSLPGFIRPPFGGNFGVLTGDPPQAQVTLDVPPLTDPALVGLTVYHAFVVLDGGIVHVSNARSLTLVP